MMRDHLSFNHKVAHNDWQDAWKDLNNINVPSSCYNTVDGVGVRTRVIYICIILSSRYNIFSTN